VGLYCECIQGFFSSFFDNGVLECIQRLWWVRGDTLPFYNLPPGEEIDARTQLASIQGRDASVQCTELKPKSAVCLTVPKRVVVSNSACLTDLSTDVSNFGRSIASLKSECKSLS
jgi:hypothetical protein